MLNAWNPAYIAAAREIRGSETTQWFSHYNETRELLLKIAQQLGSF